MACYSNAHSYKSSYVCMHKHTAQQWTERGEYKKNVPVQIHGMHSHCNDSMFCFFIHMHTGKHMHTHTHTETSFVRAHDIFHHTKI